MRELESEIEWVRAERQDAQQAAQREQKQAQARIKEAEDAASRAKAARRSATVVCSQASPSASKCQLQDWLELSVTATTIATLSIQVIDL